MFSSTIGRIVLSTAGSGMAFAGILSAGYINVDEGTRRTAQFWRFALPIYVEYRWVQFLNQDIGMLDDEAAVIKYNNLHDKHSENVKDLTYKMGGFYLKQAQLMSTQDDFIPPVYMKWMKDTQYNVPSNFGPGEAKKYVAEKLKEEKNKNFDDVFEKFDEIPLGVASIGQVHRAVLKDSHQQVAVKIQLPNMETIFRADIQTSKKFCEFAMPQFVPSFNEIEKQFLTEFDYSKEAQNLKLVRDITLPKWGHAVAIPSPIMELCSKHILVMDYLEGPVLVEGIKSQFKKFAASNNISYEELNSKFMNDMQNGNFKFKSIDEVEKENQRVKFYMGLYDTFCTLNPVRYVLNATGIFHIYSSKPIPYYKSEAPVDMAHLLRILCHVHAHQIFEGAFNGDPHPGNILLMPDGKLGLIDYGQVKRVSFEDRVVLAKLMIAHATWNKDEVVRIHMEEMKADSIYRNKEIAYLLNSFWYDRATQDVLQGKNIHVFLESLESQDPVKVIPQEFIMMGRVSVLLRGVGKAFGMDLRMSELWKDEAVIFLKKHGIKYP